jgi:hypothetical protein
MALAAVSGFVASDRLKLAPLYFSTFGFRDSLVLRHLNLAGF